MNQELQQKLDAVIDECIAAGIPLTQATRDFKVRYVQRAVDLNGGNQCRAARSIKTHRNTLSRYEPKVVKSMRKPVGKVSLSPRYVRSFSQG